MLPAESPMSSLSITCLYAEVQGVHSSEELEGLLPRKTQRMLAISFPLPTPVLGGVATFIRPHSQLTVESVFPG